MGSMYTRSGQTTACGSYATRFTVLCGLREPLKNKDMHIDIYDLVIFF